MTVASLELNKTSAKLSLAKLSVEKFKSFKSASKEM